MAIPNLILWCESAADSGEGRASSGWGGGRGAGNTARADRAWTAPPIAIEDEAVLLERVRAHDDDAFERVYLALYLPLREFAYALTRDDGAAHDVVQDVLFTFWRDRDRLEVRERFVPYLYKAVRNQCAKRWRHDRVVRSMSEASAGEPASPGMGNVPMAADDAIERSELHAALVTAVERLSERQRSVVTLHLSGGMSAAEIGDVLGMKPEAVLMNLSRARASLRAILIEFTR